MISKALVILLAVSAMAMAMTALQSAEGAKTQNPQVFKENLGYKSKGDYGCDGYKYKDRDCYKYGYCDKSNEDCDCDEYKYKDGDCDEYGNCDKAPYYEAGDHPYDGNSYKKQALDSKKEVAGKYGVHQKYP
ncbi:hypothetical protein SDJN03_03626, partial [Cucurbita argyrosperma subsp. sororia]